MPGRVGAFSNLFLLLIFFLNCALCINRLLPQAFFFLLSTGIMPPPMGPCCSTVANVLPGRRMLLYLTTSETSDGTASRLAASKKAEDE